MDLDFHIEDQSNLEGIDKSMSFLDLMAHHHLDIFEKKFLKKFITMFLIKELEIKLTDSDCLDRKIKLKNEFKLKLVFKIL